MTDMQWISELTQLESLELSGENAVYENLDFLSGLTELKVLRLPITAQGMGSYDISALANLTELTSIDLPHSVKDLTPLQGLTKLEYLSLEDGYMAETRDSFDSVEPLRNLTNLKELSVRFLNEGQVDLTPLSGMTQLQTLSIDAASGNLGQCSISSLSALSGLKELRTLTLQVHDLTDISGLENLEKLEMVSISNYTDNGLDNSKIDWSPVDHVKTVVGRD